MGYAPSFGVRLYRRTIVVADLGKQLPTSLTLQEHHRALFQRLTEVSQLPHPIPAKQPRLPFGKLGRLSLNFVLHAVGVTQLLGQFVLDLGRFIRHPSRGP